MSVPFVKTSFSSGEISPSLFGHTDLARVETAATTARNCYVDYRGGVKSRAGTLYLNRSKQRPDLGQSPCRLINWQFSNSQGYCLEFGDNYVRFYVNPQNPSEQPGPVVEAAINVSGVTQASPGVVTTASNHGYSSGDWVLFSGIGGMTILNANGYIVGTTTNTTFTLEDLDGNPVNTTTYPAFTSGGTVARIYTIASPYAAMSLDYLKFTQSADVMSLTLSIPPNANGSFGPGQAEYLPYDLKRLGPTNWTLTPTTFGASIAAPASATASATVQPGSGSPPTLPCAYAYEVTAVSFTTNDESVPSNIANITNGVDMAATNGSNIVNWAPVVGAGYYNVYRAPTSYNTDPGSSTVALPVPAGANFYLVGFCFGTQFVDSNITQDFDQSPPQHQNPFAEGQILALHMTASSTDWTHATIGTNTGSGTGAVIEAVISGGAIVAGIVINPGQNYALTDAPTFSGDGTSASGTLTIGPESGTYPGVVSYFQQRRVYAASINSPDTYWMSKPGAFTNFDTSNPVIDSDAIEGTPWSLKIDGIQWMATAPLGLLTFTGSGVWQVSAPGTFFSSPAAITPTNQAAIPQSSIGCSSTVPPLQINWDWLYAEISNNNVLDLTYQIYFNIFAGTDISWPSTHLLAPQIRQWAYCRQPDRVVWVVLQNGNLLSLTYVKEQEIAGWTRHDTQGQFRSCCSIVEPPVNALYVAVERPVAAGGTRLFIERMNNRIWSTIEDSWCVDCAVATQPDYLEATLFATAAAGAVTLTSSASVFVPTHVGQIIRSGGGIAEVTAYNSGTSVSATWLTPCVETYPNDPNNQPLPQPFGSWSIAAPVTEVAELQQLAGRQVVGLADGIPIGINPSLQPLYPWLPAASFGILTPNSLGQVTLPFSASNVVLGLGFATQLQSVYLNAGQPTIQGRRKAIYAATVRVAASALPQVGANQTDASTIPPALFVNWTQGMATPQLQYVDPTPPAAYTSPGGQPVQPLFSGDIRTPIPANFRKPGQVAAQQLLPLPMNITMFIPEIQAGDQPEDALPPRGQRQAA